MVSEFVEQHSGFLRLSDTEHALATASDPNFPKMLRVLLEYGAEREGYWTGEKCMANVENAAQIADFKYPSDRQTIVWLFDQNSCHCAFSEDTLNAKRTYIRPGGAQPHMQDTTLAGRPQKMLLEDGTPNGMKKILRNQHCSK